MVVDCEISGLTGAPANECKEIILSKDWVREKLCEI